LERCLWLASAAYCSGEGDTVVANNGGFSTRRVCTWVGKPAVAAAAAATVRHSNWMKASMIQVMYDAW
jgi:hypothetical protein